MRLPLVVLLILVHLLGTAAVRAADFPAVFDPARMSDGEGWLFTGSPDSTGTGSVTNGVGDVNGDGYADFVIGGNPPYAESSATYLIYGNPAGYESVLPDGGSDVPGRTYLGGLVRTAAIGDFNGDGFDDWLYQPVRDSWYRPGVTITDLDAYIVLGRADAYDLSFELGKVDAIRLTGTFPTESSLLSRVHPVGDMNGDGYADLMVIEFVYSEAESTRVWLISGRGGVLPASIDPAGVPASQSSTLRFPNPDYGRFADYIVPPWTVYDETTVNGGGDLNGDGFDDVIIMDDWNGGPQQAYVVFGAVNGLPTSIDSDVLDGGNGFWIASNYARGAFYDEPGSTTFANIALVRDTNGDDIDDLLIGTVTFGDTQGTGMVHVIAGGSVWQAELDVGTLPDIALFGVGTGAFNGAVLGIGDVNADGLGDWMLESDGSAFSVVYGQAAPIDDKALERLDGTWGFMIEAGGDPLWLPWLSASIGDTNGDGVDDLLLHGMPIALVYGRQQSGGPVSPSGLYPAYAQHLIELRWTLPATAALDRLELSRNGQFIANIAPDARHYEDSAAARDTDYSYSLVAVDSAGQRSSPVYLSARNDHAHYPALEGEVYSSTLAELFWVDDGNNPFFGNRDYDIYRDGELVGSRNALSWLDRNYTPAGHHYVIDTNPERYRDDYRLRSDTLYLPPDAGGRAPASVGTPSVALLSLNTVRISWQAAAWGVEPLRYELQGMGFSEPAEVRGTTSALFIDQPVTPGDYGLTYGGRIVTIDANGRRSSPLPFYAYLKQAQRALLPKEPVALVVSDITDRSARISWQLDAVGTSPAAYEVWRDDVRVAQTSAPTYIDDALQPDTRYRYEVRSLDAEGHRSLDKFQILPVLTLGGPFLPERLEALAYGPRTVEVLWPRAPRGASLVTGYAVYRDGVLLDTVDALSLMDTDVEPGVTYTYTVKSVTHGDILSDGAVTATVTTPAGQI